MVAADKNFEPKNPVCGAANFQTYYVENLSFKATANDIKQVFEKQLSMKVDSVAIARLRSDLNDASVCGRPIHGQARPDLVFSSRE